MKIITGVLALILIFTSGCFLLDANLHRSNLKVILAEDRPAYFDMGSDAAPGNQVGTLEKRAGDTIATIGRYGGGVWTYSYYLISMNGVERYILRKSVLTPDDQLYKRLGSKFKLPRAEDATAWDRVADYLKGYTKETIEITNESLIKTKARSDTTSVNYILTRVVQGQQVEYEIIAKSTLAAFDPIAEANRVAFYMVTGRIYKYED